MGSVAGPLWEMIKQDSHFEGLVGLGIRSMFLF